MRSSAESAVSTRATLSIGTTEPTHSPSRKRWTHSLELTSTMEHPSFLDLPPELHLQIFQYAHKRTLVTYSLLCRHLSSLVRPTLFQSLTLRPGPQLSSHRFIHLIWGDASVTLLPYVSKLHLSFSSSWNPSETGNILSLIRRMGPQITSLVLTGDLKNHKSLQTEIFSPILQELRAIVLPHVRHLRLEGWGQIPYFSMLSGTRDLRSLEINNCISSWEALPPIPPTLLRTSFLTEVDDVQVSFTTTSTYQATEPLLDLLRLSNASLKSFRLHGYLPSNQLSPLLPSLRSVEFLSIGEQWCKLLETGRVLSILPNLRILEVHLCTVSCTRPSWIDVFDDLSRAIPPQLQQLHIVISQNTLAIATHTMLQGGHTFSYGLDKLQLSESCSLDQILANTVGFERLTFFVARLSMKNAERHDATSLLVAKGFARLRECGKYLLAWRWGME
ncbi:hypothetical protein DL96DRAFT_1822482 [Flagelloscypha sp. PMI_526]|nr:hypothetical protein DL96DRAFT_1822482 [Flagelloscypha sp. PMI_526]